MGKSAQVPLHVWLPDSMEGPTPISALIHAATMVTAGIFMVARMSPLFEHSETALSFVTVIGATTALFMAFLGIVQNDIKRVVAYSTLSQLGYMTVALGVSAYSAAIFHLMTHAFFKALLFLGAGSVIIAMHHEQDLRRMGGLRKYMPITYVDGGDRLARAVPASRRSPASSRKDAIIEAVHLSTIPGHGYAYFAVMAGVFITAFYSFRMLFLAFHGKPRPTLSEAHDRMPTTITTRRTTRARSRSARPAWRRRRASAEGEPLGRDRAARSCSRSRRSIAGWAYIEPMLFGGYFGSSIVVLPEHDVLGKLKARMARRRARSSLHGLTAPAVLARGRRHRRRLVSATSSTRRCPTRIAPASRRDLHAARQQVLLRPVQRVVLRRRRAQARRRFLSDVGDRTIIDGFFVNGTARVVGWSAALLRHIQSGYVYHYAFTMIIGVFALLTWWVGRNEPRRSRRSLRPGRSQCARGGLSWH